MIVFLEMSSSEMSSLKMSNLEIWQSNAKSKLMKDFLEEEYNARISSRVSDGPKIQFYGEHDNLLFIAYDKTGSHEDVHKMKIIEDLPKAYIKTEIFPHLISNLAESDEYKFDDSHNVVSKTEGSYLCFTEESFKSDNSISLCNQLIQFISLVNIRKNEIPISSMYINLYYRTNESLVTYNDINPSWFSDCSQEHFDTYDFYQRKSRINSGYDDSVVIDSYPKFSFYATPLALFNMSIKKMAEALEGNYRPEEYRFTEDIGINFMIAKIGDPEGSPGYCATYSWMLDNIFGVNSDIYLHSYVQANFNHFFQIGDNVIAGMPRLYEMDIALKNDSKHGIEKIKQIINDRCIENICIELFHPSIPIANNSLLSTSKLIALVDMDNKNNLHMLDEEATVNILENAFCFIRISCIKPPYTSSVSIMKIKSDYVLKNIEADTHFVYTSYRYMMDFIGERGELWYMMQAAYMLTKESKLVLKAKNLSKELKSREDVGKAGYDIEHHHGGLPSDGEYRFYLRLKHSEEIPKFIIISSIGNTCEFIKEELFRRFDFGTLNTFDISFLMKDISDNYLLLKDSADKRMQTEESASKASVSSKADSLNVQESELKQ